MNKLAQYSSLAAATLAGVQTADAQIAYTNLDPDLFTNGPLVYLDLDADGENDIDFRVWLNAFDDTYYSYAMVGNLNNPSLYIATNGGISWPELGVKEFAYGEIINSSVNFVDPQFFDPEVLGGFSFYTGGGYSGMLENHGDFFNEVNKFMAFRIGPAGDYHYGWIRLSVPYTSPFPSPFNDGLELFVHDFAINLTPNTAVFAGATGLECNAPFQLDPVLLSPTQVKIKWLPTADAVNYKLYYRKIGAPSWTIKNIAAPKTSKIINGLTCNTNYEWKMRASCDGGATFSAYSDTKTFTTGACRVDGKANEAELIIYPNPASDKLYLDLINMDDPQILIYDLTGQIIESIHLESGDVLSIDISNYVNGIYFLSLSDEFGSRTVKFIKQ